MLDHTKLHLEMSGEKTFGPCECCGEMTQRVWGYVYENDTARAAYFVEWTPGHSPTAATFDLIVGLWGEHTTISDREAVSLAFRHDENGPAFMVTDASEQQTSQGGLASTALTRDQVLSSSVATDAFAILDEIYLKDPRIAELRHE